MQPFPKESGGENYKLVLDYNFTIIKELSDSLAALVPTLFLYNCNVWSITYT